MSGNPTIAQFKRTIWAHYRRTGRATLPWRHTRDPYAIFISEVMLQQTQVTRVEGYYAKWLARFPDFSALARARTADVLAVWQGLGYNRRALFLKRAAEIVVKKYGGSLPRDRAALQALPGIGKGTSGSLMVFAFDEPEVFIETNIRRVFIHFFFPRKKYVTDAELERYIKSSLDRKRPREWYWALMDCGAAMKRENPNRRSAHYKKQAKFEGSQRQLRGRLLRLMVSAPKRGEIDVRELPAMIGVATARIRKAIVGLEKEGFIVRKGYYICIKT
ncbi:MAG TPA: A/G-specific adenine glycosylase [Candidatus Paceibacterota bacterium]|nr:A/G-specific adenine glycosylase [Candidatus Paceibacterota bacterium]